MDLIPLQIKSPELVQFYMIAVCSVCVVALLFFGINKRFRGFVIRYCRSHPWFVGLLTSFYLIYLISRIFFVDTLFLSLFYEDGVFEYLTTVFFVVSSLGLPAPFLVPPHLDCFPMCDTSWIIVTINHLDLM